MDGSRQVIASYFTLEEAETRARKLRQFSGEQYHVYDLLTQELFIRKEKEENTTNASKSGI